MPTILVIEDDSAIRRGVTDALRFSGYTVLEAAEGSGAVKRSADHLLQIFDAAVTLESIMTMTFDIPADVQSGVADIPGLDARVAMYLRHEAQLEAVRRRRHSAEARGIVQRALEKADTDRAAGFDWDASFGELQKLHQDITSKF